MMNTKKIWAFYNFAILLAILATTLSNAKSIAQFLLPLFLVPLVLYLSRDIKRKSKHKNQGDIVYATDVVKIKEEPALVGEVLPTPGVSDDNRRIFLKLVGSTGLSLIFMAVLGKKSAQAAFFGSVPGPGAVTIKDSAGVAIDPAEKQSTDGYEISEVDDSGATSYYGFVHKTGSWYITKEDASGGYRYSKGAGDFATGWTGRASLTYGYFDTIF